MSETTKKAQHAQISWKHCIWISVYSEKQMKPLNTQSGANSGWRR